ncbi:hypothetical protein [Lysinibacillus fusiformis]|uniref:hypothetical protein n=1 Tax=Lysinibacillus fusiformis TaxID=28031 RepID=UPI0018830D00|nr:hypothetical protein [Lysinibacillus fusiformis]MBD8520940.1 hypothetical protein [Lysinibacillus fusiformis]
MEKTKAPPKKKEPQHSERDEFDLEEPQKVMTSVWLMYVLLFFVYTEVSSLYKAGRRECVLIMSSNLGYYLFRLNDNDYHYKQSNCFATIHKLWE